MTRLIILPALALLAAFVAGAPTLDTTARATADDVATEFKISSTVATACPLGIKISNAVPQTPEKVTNDVLRNPATTVIAVESTDINLLTPQGDVQCPKGDNMWLVNVAAARTPGRLAALRFPIAARTATSNRDAAALLQSAPAAALVGFNEGPRKCGAFVYPAGSFFIFTRPSAPATLNTAGRTVTVPGGMSVLLIAGPGGELCVMADEATTQNRNVTVAVRRTPTPPAPPTNPAPPAPATAAPVPPPNSPAPRPPTIAPAPQPPVTGTDNAEASPAAEETPVAAPAENNSPVCFPGSAIVELEDGSRVEMKDIRIGDRVRTSAQTFSDVFLFTHRDAGVHAQFVRLVTASGESVSLTKSHYIYANRVLVSAGEVRRGDALELADGSFSPVTSVEDISGNGLYNPQTVDGNIVVDGVVASAYTTAVHPRVAHGALLAPVRAAYAWVSGSLPVLDALAGFISESASALSRVVPSGPSAMVA